MTVIPTHSLSSFPSRFHSIPVTGHFPFSTAWQNWARVTGHYLGRGGSESTDKYVYRFRDALYVSESQTSTDAELWLLRQYGIVVYTAPVYKHASANYRKELTIPGGCSSLRFIILSSADKVVGSDQITRRTRVLCRYLPARLPS